LPSAHGWEGQGRPIIYKEKLARRSRAIPRPVLSEKIPDSQNRKIFLSFLILKNRRRLKKSGNVGKIFQGFGTQILVGENLRRNRAAEAQS
jgi:hypothetical protein